eukprot:7815826-Prorocentrum_lima.AAC.1
MCPLGHSLTLRALEQPDQEMEEIGERMGQSPPSPTPQSSRRPQCVATANASSATRAAGLLAGADANTARLLTS